METGYVDLDNVFVIFYGKGAIAKFHKNQENVIVIIRVFVLKINVIVLKQMLGLIVKLNYRDLWNSKNHKKK